MPKFRHPLYPPWNGIKQRCLNPKASGYHRYGGRGIKIAEEFLDFWAFVEYVEGVLGPRPDGFQLDRIDNDGNYTKGNLRWSSRSDQAKNRHQHTGFLRYDNRKGLWGATRSRHRWQAAFGYKGKNYYCGLYDTEAAAHQASIEKRSELCEQL